MASSSQFERVGLLALEHFLSRLLVMELTARCSRGTTGRFWQHNSDIAENADGDFKRQSLPLARIKKVMRSDPEVKVGGALAAFGLSHLDAPSCR